MHLIRCAFSRSLSFSFSSSSSLPFPFSLSLCATYAFRLVRELSDRRRLDPLELFVRPPLRLEQRFHRRGHI